MKITQVRLNAAAKINLTLDIKGIREDGYHELETVMQTVSLYDTVQIKATDTKRIDLSVNVPFIPTDSRNTCCKAVEAYFVACGKENPGVEIQIVKNIPSSAGMGGGSADAAAVLRGLEYIFGKCPQDIFKVAAKIGADVPFCLAGGTQLCKGIGEIMTPIHLKPSDTKGIHLVIAKNARGLSTPHIFSQYDTADKSDFARPDSQKLIQALKDADIKKLAENVANILQPVAVAQRPEIALLISEIKKDGALNAVMTGSGAAVFGIFDNFSAARRCANRLKESGCFAEYAKFVNPKK